MNLPSGAQKMRKAVVFCVDSTYFPYALFLADQLHHKEPHRDYDICLVSASALEIPEEFAYLNLKIPPPLDAEDYKKINVTHLPRSAYLRMWVPHILGQDYDRIIYLDSDIFADAAGLSRLFEVDMRGKSVAAVRDVQQWYRPTRNVKEFELAGRPLRLYFNSGFLLIDPVRYREDRVLERALAIGVAHPEWVLLDDQSLLNLALDGDWLELSPVWNWQWPWKYPLFTDWVGPRLLHFIGPMKPWNDPKGFSPKRFGMAYAEFLGNRFPSLPPIKPPSISVLHSKRRVAWLLLRFLALRPKLLGYREQFPDPYQPRQEGAGPK